MTKTMDGKAQGTTPRLSQGHPKATPRLHQGYTKATPRLHQGYTKATPRLHQGYTKATPEPPEATLVTRVRRLMSFPPSAFGIRPSSSRTHSILALLHCPGVNASGMFEFMLLVPSRIVKAIVMVVVLVAIHYTCRGQAQPNSQFSTREAIGQTGPNRYYTPANQVITPACIQV